jgi:hypothetical protein
MVVVVVDAVLSAHNPNGNAHATALYDQLRGSASYGGVAVGGAAGARSRTRAIYAVMSVLLTSGAGGPLPVPGRCSGGLGVRPARQAWPHRTSTDDKLVASDLSNNLHFRLR